MLLVWILIIAPITPGTPTQLGPFLDIDSCQRVMASPVLKKFEKQCLHVNMAL